MKTILRHSMLAAALLLSFDVSAERFLNAVKVDKAPVLASLAADPAWASAKPATIKLHSGQGFTNGRTLATIKAVYTVDSLYMLISYDDPTRSVRLNPYQKQADGSWKQLVDPQDRGGDDNRYHEDKWAMFWNVGNSMREFRKRGCFAGCHEEPTAKSYGNKYTKNPGDIGDLWVMRSVRGGISLGQPDNGYLDDTRFDKDKALDAGRKADASTGGGHEFIRLVNGKPEFMNKDAKPANKGGTYWVKAEDKVPFDDSRFVAGDEVASVVVSAFSGDRGVLSGAGGWANGKWTYVVSRRLTTASPYDIQFKDLDVPYYFGFAAFDNAEVQHTLHKGTVVLKFVK